MVPNESKNNKFAKKQKDPNMIAAGRKLAEYNRKAKEALPLKMKRDKVKAINQYDDIHLMKVGRFLMPKKYIIYNNIMSCCG